MLLFVIFYVLETRKRKGAEDASPKAKLAKKETKKVVRSTKTKTPTQKGATLGRKVVTRTRSYRSSIVGPSGGVGSYKPDFTEMINLITLQTFDGSWDLSKNLAAILRKSVDDLTSAIPEPNLVS